MQQPEGSREEKRAFEHRSEENEAGEGQHRRQFKLQSDAKAAPQQLKQPADQTLLNQQRKAADSRPQRLEQPRRN